MDRAEIKQLKILLDFKDTLQKYFGIKCLVPYEKFLISEIGFNVRVQNCLMTNDYGTLAELLKSSKQKILRLMHFRLVV